MGLFGKCTVCQRPGWILTPNLDNNKALAIPPLPRLGKSAEARSQRALSTVLRRLNCTLWMMGNLGRLLSREIAFGLLKKYSITLWSGNLRGGLVEIDEKLMTVKHQKLSTHGCSRKTQISWNSRSLQSSPGEELVYTKQKYQIQDLKVPSSSD